MVPAPATSWLPSALPTAPPALARVPPRPPAPGCRPGPGVPAPEGTWEACFGLLEGLSRTFAPGVRGLRAPLDRAVVVAALLCQLVDTLAQAPGWDVARKGRALRLLRRQLEGGVGIPIWHEAVAQALGAACAPGELALLRALPTVLAAFESLAPDERPVIARCVHEMATGLAEMQAVLERQKGQVRLLPSADVLHRYCHYVTGTVGTLLTELLFLRSPHVDKERFFALSHHTESFAQLLQRTRLLRDLPATLAAGACFVPRDTLQTHGLTAAQLVSPAHRDGALRALTPLVTSALEQLPGAWRYLTLVPVAEREMRLLLACRLFFALRTLRQALVGPERLLEGGGLELGREEVSLTVQQLEERIDQPAQLFLLYADLTEECRKRSLGLWSPDVLRALAALP